MVPLTRYFLWFFFLCFVFTCICGVVAALMPTGMGAVLTIVPYLVAMIWVLFNFLKKEQRAPTQAERKKFTLGFSLIYWGYNLVFLILGIAISATATIYEHCRDHVPAHRDSALSADLLVLWQTGTAYGSKNVWLRFRLFISKSLRLNSRC